MNDYHAAKEGKYKPRWLADTIRAAVVHSPVLVLSGARQVGKSTLLRNEPPFSEWPYITMDNYDLAAQAKAAPDSLWAKTDTLVIDEVQKVPEILPAIKAAVDERGSRKRFILSGSANLSLMRNVPESLAGRAAYMTLLPMALGEFYGRSAPNWLADAFKGRLNFPEVAVDHKRPEPYILQGLMPRPMALKARDEQLRWWEGYVATYLERDLRQLSQVDSLIDFRRVMEAVALRSGQILNQTEVSRDTAVSQPTVFRYLNLLGAGMVLTRLPAYTSNRTKRLIKSPKPYWLDPGLACYLCGHYDMAGLKGSREAGALFETFVLLHLRAACQLMTPSPRIYYWRTVTGHEVDFVLEYGRELLAVEVKLAESPGWSDTASLRLFLEEYPAATSAVLIHAGAETRWFGKNLVAIPWRSIAG